MWLVAGCEHVSNSSGGNAAAKQEATQFEVHVVRPERKTVRYTIEQPGFNIEPFQQTPLYAKIAGYIDKWNVDIGDAVKKGQLLAELYVPELAAELEQKDAAVREAAAHIEQARAAESIAKAQLERSRSQYERLERVSRGGMLDRENVDETRLGYDASKAALQKAAADVTAAEAQLAAAKANRQYAAAMLGYAQIRAPFDGILTQRNINSGDFVQPAASGDKGRPLFVVDQVDPVRVFLQIPGADAAWVKNGDPVTLRLQGAAGQVIQARVTRNAQSLTADSRTLRTEIDLPNPYGELLPGMYAQAKINVEHANVWTLPAQAVLTTGSEAICYRLVAGRAVRTPLELGLRGGGLVEVVRMLVHASSSPEPGTWQAAAGNEQIIIGNLVALSDGQAVQLARPAKAPPAAK